MPDLANAPDFAVQFLSAEGVPAQLVSDEIQAQLTQIVGTTPTMRRTTDDLIASTRVITIGAWLDLAAKPSPAETAARDAWIATVTPAQSILLESRGDSLSTFAYFVTLSGLNSIIGNQLKTLGTTYNVAPKIDVILSSAVVTLNPAHNQMTTTIQGRVTALSVPDIHLTLSRTDTLGTKAAADGSNVLAVTSSTSGHANSGDLAKATAEGLINPVAGTAAVIVGTLIDARVLPHDIVGAGDMLAQALPAVILTPSFGDGFGKITFGFLPPLMTPQYVLCGTLALPAPRVLSATVIGPAQVTIGAGATVVPTYRVQTSADLEPGFPVTWKGDAGTVFERLAADSHAMFVRFSPPPGAVDGTTTHHTISAVCGPDSDGFSVATPPFAVTAVVDTLKRQPLPHPTPPRPISQK